MLIICCYTTSKRSKFIKIYIIFNIIILLLLFFFTVYLKIFYITVRFKIVSLTVFLKSSELFCINAVNISYYQMPFFFHISLFFYLVLRVLGQQMLGLNSGLCWDVCNRSFYHRKKSSLFRPNVKKMTVVLKTIQTIQILYN